MKEQLSEQPFVPNEEGWSRLQAALPQSPAAAPAPPKAMPLLPLWAKVAASVALLIGAGTLAYRAFQKEQQPAVAVHTQKAAPAMVPAATLPAVAAPVVTPATTSVPAATTAAGTFHAIARSQPKQPSLRHPVPQPPVPQQQAPVIADPVGPSPEHPVVRQEEVPGRRNVPGRDLHNGPVYPDYPQDAPGRRRSSAVNFGVAALVGRASVGQMQYQVGVVARKNLSEKLYAEAAVTFAATDVRYSQPNTFKSVGSFNGALGAADQVVSAEYSRNVLSLGIAPGISYKILPRLAVTVGGAVAYNLNKSLPLENEDDIDKSAVSNNIIHASQEINQWDIGLTGSLDCKVTKRLSASAQYRHGLSTYLYERNEPVRNSGVNVGVKFLFGK